MSGEDIDTHSATEYRLASIIATIFYIFSEEGALSTK
jgi:hypothetical protein